MASSIPLLGSLDLVCAVGVSCRLPGEVMRPDALWDILGSEYQRASSSSLPHSREFASYKPGHSIPNHKGQWLGAAEPEAIDAFFGIRDTDAATLHLNTRLSLELTQEALESTGIPPSSLRGKNVAVIVDVSNADGWGMKRSQYTSSAPSASHHSWATSSDPSGIAGHISYLFDFCGISSTVSNVCDGGALAIHNGVLALQQGNADIAIICAIATHVAPSAFASSPDANGYPPVEGAVFFILKPLSAAGASGDAVLGIIRGIALGHYDSTRSLNTSSVEAHIEVAERAMLNANVGPHDIALVEATSLSFIMPILVFIASKFMMLKYPQVSLSVLSVLQRPKTSRGRGVSMTRISLAWLLHKKGVTAPIIGPTSIEQIEDSIGALNISFTKEEMAYLEEPYKAQPELRKYLIPNCEEWEAE